jgi:regulator of protease activity HflC (stomatin/prohibitin superfamily)
VDLASLIVVLGHRAGVIFFIGNAVRVIRQQRVGVVERLGKFRRTWKRARIWWCRSSTKVRYNMDMRENVVPFPPQGVITEDNLMVNIDSVIYFQIIDPVRAAYEAPELHQGHRAADDDHARNIIGGLILNRP